MIYVLFGPPGVGKTFLGTYLQKEKGIFFYDADDEILEEEKRAIQDRKYDQKMRDNFVKRLSRKVNKFHDKHKNIVLAEAFTKETNRIFFFELFKPQIKFIRVMCPYLIARKRVIERINKEEHVIDLKSFEHFWNNFEEPRVEHALLDNTNGIGLESVCKKIVSQ